MRTLSALLVVGSALAQQDGAAPAAGAPAERPFLVDQPPEEILRAARHGPAGEDTPLPEPAGILAAVDRGVAFLLGDQNEDGSWGSWREPQHEFWSNPYSHHAWIDATTGLVIMSLLERHEAAGVRAAIERGLKYLLDKPLSKRPSDWDVDNTWGSVYVLDTVTSVLAHEAFATSALREPLRAKAAECVAALGQYQASSGGWGYYDFDTLAARPSWSTSFQTAAAVVGLVAAREQGLEVPDKMLAAATAALLRARLPTGAYSYSIDPIPNMRLEWIDNVKGSLSRIQSCNYALLRLGREEIGRDEILAGLDLFFEHHRFLDVARKKPVPHEAYYLNSGYFYFFGHFYAARLLERLQPGDRARYASRLAREIVKTQEADGSMWDYSFNTYGKPYGTAFGVLTLLRTLPER